MNNWKLFADKMNEKERVMRCALAVACTEFWPGRCPGFYVQIDEERGTMRVVLGLTRNAIIERSFSLVELREHRFMLLRRLAQKMVSIWAQDMAEAVGEIDPRDLAKVFDDLKIKPCFAADLSPLYSAIFGGG